MFSGPTSPQTSLKKLHMTLQGPSFWRKSKFLVPFCSLFFSPNQNNPRAAETKCHEKQAPFHPGHCADGTCESRCPEELGTGLHAAPWVMAADPDAAALSHALCAFCFQSEMPVHSRVNLGGTDTTPIIETPGSPGCTWLQA